MDSKPYFPNLDASRFLAFILVFLGHCFITTQESLEHSSLFQFVFSYGKFGFLGLEYFFVLSSFLITYLILEEQRKTRRFHIKNFLIRRSLRVWPLYFIVVGIGYLLSFIASHFFETALAPIPDFQYFLFFIVNFYAVEHGTNFLFFLAFLWSISIEEQFYLCWAFIMRYYRKKVFPSICLLLILFSIAFRFYYLDNDRQLYFNTISTIGNFGIGSYIAYMAFYKTRLFLLIQEVKKVFICIFYVVFISSIILFHELREFDFFIGIQRTYYAILFALFILDQSFGKNRLFNVGNVPFFNYLGKISYGLYCYHGIVITLLIQVLKKTAYQQNYWDVFVLFPLIIFTFTVIISAVSYRYVEGYFLTLKKRFDDLIKTE